MNALAQSLARSPALFPMAMDAQSDSVAVIRLTRGDYEQASFLDERVASRSRPLRNLHYPELEEAVGFAGLPENSDFIFHIGHVGSTLLSRLLGAHPAIFSLREPAILRTLAQIRSGTFTPPTQWSEENFAARLSTILRLYSRTFEEGSKSLVKATSFVSELAVEILSRESHPRALLMFVRPESYLATILGGENAPIEAKALMSMRRQRLERRLGRPLESASLSSPGRIIAMAWLCEMSALAVANRNSGERIRLVDFDSFLVEPESSLFDCFRHLGLAASEQSVVEIVAGPVMQRYAKAPEHPYDADVRSAILDQARANWGDEIRIGLNWLERLAKEHALVLDALALCEI